MFEWHGNGGSTISSCHGIFAVYSQKTSWAPGLTFQASGAKDQLQTIEFRVWIGPDMTMTTCDHPSKSTDAKNKWLFRIQSSPWRGNEACHADEGALSFPWSRWASENLWRHFWWCPSKELLAPNDTFTQERKAPKYQTLHHPWPHRSLHDLRCFSPNFVGDTDSFCTYPSQSSHWNDLLWVVAICLVQLEWPDALWPKRLKGAKVTVFCMGIHWNPILGWAG